MYLDSHQCHAISGQYIGVSPLNGSIKQWPGTTMWNDDSLRIHCRLLQRTETRHILTRGWGQSLREPSIGKFLFLESFPQPVPRSLQLQNQQFWWTCQWQWVGCQTWDLCELYPSYASTPCPWQCPGLVLQQAWGGQLMTAVYREMTSLIHPLHTRLQCTRQDISNMPQQTVQHSDASQLQASILLWQMLTPSPLLSLCCSLVSPRYSQPLHLHCRFSCTGTQMPHLQKLGPCSTAANHVVQSS